jgi:hypothetical protein
MKEQESKSKRSQESFFLVGEREKALEMARAEESVDGSGLIRIPTDAWTKSTSTSSALVCLVVV